MLNRSQETFKGKGVYWRKSRSHLLGCEPPSLGKGEAIQKTWEEQKKASHTGEYPGPMREIKVKAEAKANGIQIE